jgi:effector-binding domain-containing protein
VVGIRSQVRRADVGEWCGDSFPGIEAAVAAAGTDPAGPAGATYDAAFFEQDVGEVLVFVPVAQAHLLTTLPAFPAGPEGQIESLTLPAGRFAVTVHTGGYDQIDRSYGHLGSYVAEHDDGLPEPIREHYLVGPDRTPHPNDYRTEIWWPIRPHPAPTNNSAAGTSPAGTSTHKET